MMGQLLSEPNFKRQEWNLFRDLEVPGAAPVGKVRERKFSIDLLGGIAGECMLPSPRAVVTV